MDAVEVSERYGSLLFQIQLVKTVDYYHVLLFVGSITANDVEKDKNQEIHSSFYYSWKRFFGCNLNFFYTFYFYIFAVGYFLGNTQFMKNVKMKFFLIHSGAFVCALIGRLLLQRSDKATRAGAR